MLDISAVTLTVNDGVKVTFDKNEGPIIHADTQPFTKEELEYLRCLYLVIFPSKIVIH